MGWIEVVHVDNLRLKVLMFHIEQVLAFKVNTPFWAVCVHSISLVPLVPSQTCAVANNPKILACYALHKISLQLVE